MAHFQGKEEAESGPGLSLLMWLQTFIDLLGYVMYPADEDRYCKNKASPYMASIIVP